MREAFREIIADAIKDTKELTVKEIALFVLFISALVVASIIIGE